MRMIPIECPRCGREGNVPPDRLNAKLTCRGCQAVFHLDTSGRMVMGSPGAPSKERQRPQVQYSQPGEPFNLSEAWEKFPKAAKIGVPVVLVVLAAWQFLPGGGSGYEGSSAAIVRGLLANDRSRVVSYATSAGADATGKWFDLMHAQAEKQGIPSGTVVTPALLSGNPEKDSSLVLMVVIPGSSPTAAPLSMNLHMVRSGSSWQIDGEKSLSDAQESIATASKKSRP
jgi:hypothetical protein